MSRRYKSLEYEIDSEGLDEAIETETPSMESMVPETSKNGMIKKDKLINLRSKPIMDDRNIMGTLPGGTEVEILSSEDENGFLKVRVKGGRTGYISSKFCEVI